MGFYNASEWRTAWDLEKSLLWLHPQPFYFCFKKDTQNSQRSRLLAGILSRFCQSISPNPPPRCTLLTNTMSHLVLSQILSLICQRLPLPNPDLTPERTLGLPLALHMLTLPFPEVVLENLWYEVCSNINKIQVHYVSDRICMSNSKAFTPL